MSKNIPNKKNLVFKIHDKSCLKSFAFQEIDEEEVNFALITSKSTQHQDQMESLLGL